MRPRLRPLGNSGRTRNSLVPLVVPGYTGTMETTHQTGRRTSLGIFVGFLAGTALVFSVVCRPVQRRHFPAAVVSSRLCPIRSAPRVGLPAPSDSRSVVACRVGVALGGLVVARNHFKFRMAHVIGMARLAWCGVWNERAWCAVRGCPAASQADPDRPCSRIGAHCRARPSQHGA
jgi:hypothetical protein